MPGCCGTSVPWVGASSLRPLSGRVAVVTGASSGLGRATADRLAADGAAVALLARSADDLIGTQSRITQRGGTALALPTDLADAAAIEAVVTRVAAELGRIDVLVNAAATDVPGPVETLDQEDWDRVIAVNLTAPFALAKAVWPHLRRAGGGTIINVSSVAGRRGWARAAAYCATKFALTGLTQSLAAEGRPHGIRACVVYPGAMATAWGVWDSTQRDSALGSDQAANHALPASQVADLIGWIAAAPANLVLNEATVTPLLEQGWP
jgi:NAD(P)-dependent dehydrogenase (short-subunit alcohol dehydrogenase family)